jgi:hypothetical protein
MFWISLLELIEIRHIVRHLAENLYVIFALDQMIKTFHNG